MVVSIAKELGWPNLEIRVGLTADMAARNALITKVASKTKDRKAVFEISDIEATQPDFYEDTSALEFQAEVLHCIPLTKDMISRLTFSGEVESIPSYAVVTDRTLFYPEGGGQLGDQGRLLQDGNEYEVLDTKSQDGVIFHFTENPLAPGKVKGILDWDRRKQLMDHHTAVHIVGGAARNILGPHIWQAGSNKGARYARLDITHHS